MIKKKFNLLMFSQKIPKNQIKILIETDRDKREFNKCLRMTAHFFPFFPFIISFILTFSFPSKDSPLYTFLYVFASTSDIIKIIVATKKNVSYTQSVLKIIWLSKHTHDLFLCLTMAFTCINTIHFTLPAFIVYYFQLFKGFKKDFAPKLGSSKEYVISLCDSLLSFRFLHIVRSNAQIFFPIYLLNNALFRRDSNFFICFLSVFFSYSLYAMITDQFHRSFFRSIENGYKKSMNIQHSKKGSFLLNVENRIKKITNIMTKLAYTIYPVNSIGIHMKKF